MSRAGRPRGDLSKYPVPQIIDHLVRGDHVFDTWARGFPPAEGDKRSPSEIQRWIGRYATREDALAAFEHYKATGERLPGRSKPRPAAGTRTGYVLVRPGRFDAKGRTVGQPGARHIGTFATRELAAVAVDKWLADPTYSAQTRSRGPKAPRPSSPDFIGPRRPRGRRPAAPRDQRPAVSPRPRAKRKPTVIVAPPPPVSASPQPPDPRRRKPGETAVDWMRRLNVL